MILNYIKIAWRNITKNKMVFGINVFGLGVGFASCILIALFVFNELSYDRFNEKADRIARVIFKANINGEVMNEGVVMAPVAQTFKAEFPEVLDATRLTNLFNPKITYKHQTFRDSKFAYVDPNFFTVFTLPIIEGDTKNPLGEPHTVVLTTSEAKKYFGNEHPIGKTIQLDNYDSKFKVTALIDEVPENSHFHFDMFASSLGYKEAKSTSWVNSEFFTYLLLKENTNLEYLEQKIPAVLKTHLGAQLQEAMGITYDAFLKTNKIGLYLQPLTDIHLKSDVVSSSELEEGGDIKFVYIFSFIALLILIMACVNFINLSTAAASKRAKEIGIRKTLGSSKIELIKQFLFESSIATFIAAILGVLLVALCVPFLSETAQIPLEVSTAFSPLAILSFVMVVLIVGGLAGVYPAFVLSSIKTIDVLKNGVAKFGKNKHKGRRLVVFQFIISAGLIFSTLVVYKQIQFINKKDIGYQKDHLLVLRDAYVLGNNLEAFKTKLKAYPQIEQLSQSGYVPVGKSNRSMSGIFKDGRFVRRMFVYNIDENYLSTLGMTLLDGRNFSAEYGLETNHVIINETASKRLGFGADPIGQIFERDTNEGKKQLTVIGLVKDFNFKTLHHEIEPLIMRYNPNGGLIVKAKGEDIASVLASVRSMWKDLKPNEPFTYSLLDESFKKAHLEELKMGKLLTFFSLLAIFIACLGLFGLAAFTAQQRTKEIGVRKVLGASVLGITQMLSKDFVKLVLVAFVIAFPLAFWLMNNWLQNFAYRTSIGIVEFVVAGIASIVIALVTVSFHSIRAARANPVESLKTE